jgi:hypothetical protein
MGTLLASFLDTKVKRRNTELPDRVTTKGGVFGTNSASRMTQPTH